MIKVWIGVGTRIFRSPSLSTKKDAAPREEKESAIGWGLKREPVSETTTQPRIP
jgi:hypothetical protein